MSGFNAKFTMVAGKAMDFAALFNHAFRAGLPGPIPFRVELTTPVGPSTGGGTQALQHIRLVPTVSGPALVIGSVNSKDQSAELRAFQLVADNYAARFKGALSPLDHAAYADLIKRMHSFFTSQAYTVRTIAISTSIPPLAGPETSASQATMWILVAFALLLVAAGAGAFFFLRL